MSSLLRKQKEEGKKKKKWGLRQVTYVTSFYLKPGVPADRKIILDINVNVLACEPFLSLSLFRSFWGTQIGSIRENFPVHRALKKKEMAVLVLWKLLISLVDAVGLVLTSSSEWDFHSMNKWS